jgi:DNA-binding MarR family transcriptional regulator
MSGSDHGAVALTVMRLFRALERVDSGLTPQQYRMLKLVGAGSERSARLAERLAVAKPTLTTTADGLVAAGLVHREPELGDRRVVRLCLTQAGREAVDRADSAYSDWLDALLESTGQAARIRRDLDLLDSALDDHWRMRMAKPSAEPDRAPSLDQAADPVNNERTQVLAHTIGSACEQARGITG